MTLHLFYLVSVLTICLQTSDCPALSARGTVYHDENLSGRREEREKGIGNVAISNGTQVVLTDEQGRYEIPVKKDTVLFLIKPAGWMTPTNAQNLPQFYYIYSPDGSPRLKHKAVEPTGPLPPSIDFPLYRNKEPEKFEVIIFGDPQTRYIKSIQYLWHDAIEEVAGSDAAFGITLGDITFDYVNLYPRINEAMALLGLPWYNLPGNHDMNYDAAGDEYALETYKSVYGPPWYAFNYGPVHFIVLDTIISKKGNEDYLVYDEGLTDSQLEFVKNDLATVDKNRLVVVLSHASLQKIGKNKRDVLEVLSDFPHTLSVAGHEHVTENIFLKEQDGWKGRLPHHVYLSGAVCGSWWMGLPGEEGLPHAMMSNGVPNGYSVLTFDKNQYSIRFKAFGKSPDYQMRAYMPEEIKQADLADTQVLLNVFAGSEKSVVEMRVGPEGRWRAMERVITKDPYCEQVLAEEDQYGYERPDWARRCHESGHIWRASLAEESIGTGTHMLYFRSTDMYGQQFSGKRIFRIQ